MERRLLNAGIADTNLLARAAALDKAADSFLAEAVTAANGLELQNSQERKPCDPAATARRSPPRTLPGNPAQVHLRLLPSGKNLHQGNTRPRPNGSQPGHRVEPAVSREPVQ
jgi:hypothetical protein